MSTNPSVTTFALYFEYWQFVFDLLPTYGVRGPDQEDIAQVVWENVEAQIVSYDPARQSPRAWLTGFVRRCAANYRRGRRRRPESITAEPAMGVAAPGLTPEQWVMLKDIERVLPDEAVRETFLLRIRHELTIEEIAAAAGMSRGHVEWSLHQARRALRGKALR